MPLNMKAASIQRNGWLPETSRQVEASCPRRDGIGPVGALRAGGSGARAIASAATIAPTTNSSTSQPARSGISRLADSSTPSRPKPSRLAVIRTRSSGPSPSRAPQAW
jgi:hypothetical protein